MTKDRADELLEEQKAKVDEEVAALDKEISGIKETLESLKKHLYGRFGQNINLEE